MTTSYVQSSRILIIKVYLVAQSFFHPDKFECNIMQSKIEIKIY